MRQQPYTGAEVLTPGINLDVSAQPQGCFIATTVAGHVRLLLKASGSFLDVPVAVGASLLDDLAVIGVDAGNTTATCVVSALFV